MSRLSLLVLASILSTPTLIACSCVAIAPATGTNPTQGATGPYCGALRGTKVVFVGLVVEDSGEKLGSGPAKMIVEEVLHGLPSDTRELTVDTGAGTSCYMRLEKGQRYVIYGSPKAGSANRVNRDWCSFSFNVAGNELLLNALRDAEAGRNSRLVGKVRMKYEQYDVSGEGAPGVRVVASSGNVRREELTGSDGEFEFSDVPPGDYHLQIDSTALVEDEAESPREDLHVSPGACGYQTLYVWPNGRIEGVVKSPAGKPTEGVPVQAFVRTRRGTMDTKPLKESRTDPNGVYSLSGLPPGEFAIAVNGEQYDDKLPWPPTFYRNAHDREQAEWLRLTRGEQLSGVDLQLPSPRMPAVLHIEAVFEDGTPATDAGVNVENLSGVQRAFALGRKDTNLVGVPVYVGETYQIRSFLFHVTSSAPIEIGKPIRMESKSWSALSGPIRVTTPDVHVRVVLLPNKQ